MKTIGTLRMKEIMIIEESNKEKDRAFQEKLAKIIIYYCSGCGKGYLPINEKLFLTAVVRGLARVVGIKSMKIITPYCLSRQYWRDDVGRSFTGVSGDVDGG